MWQDDLGAADIEIMVALGSGHRIEGYGQCGGAERAGSGPSGYPAEPLVSYQINRQFSGWLLPPQVIRAFRAHCQVRTFPLDQLTGSVNYVGRCEPSP